jgi:hypothetical protein
MAWNEEQAPRVLDLLAAVGRLEVLCETARAALVAGQTPLAVAAFNAMNAAIDSMQMAAARLMGDQ